MWNVFEGISILLFVFICSATSDEKCTIYRLPIGSGMTTLLESINKEENFWIKPQYDFERLEIHLKVNNILTITSSFFLHKHILVKTDSILESSYYQKPYWIPMKIKVSKRTPLIGLSRMILRATVNNTIVYELDDSLWYSQYAFQKFKLSAEGGISISRCNPNETITEAPTTLKSTSVTTLKATSVTTQKSTSVTTLKSESTSSFPNYNPTETYTRDRDEEYVKTSIADILKNEGRYSLIILLITVALLAIILIASICFFIWRKKINNRCLSKTENEGQESMYESVSERYFVSEGNKAPPVPPPTYSSKYPSLSSSESKKGPEEIMMENPYEVPKKTYPNPYVESQYLEMSANQ